VQAARSLEITEKCTVGQEDLCKTVGHKQQLHNDKQLNGSSVQDCTSLLL